MTATLSIGKSRLKAQSTQNSAPTMVGSGFLAQDLLLVGKDRINANQRYAGGSFGNVVSILAFLGWNSFPVARLGKDRRATEVIGDLQNSRVKTDFIIREQGATTPVIVLRLLEGEGGTYMPKFEWRDPRSKSWLPRYRPLPKAHAERVKHFLPVASVFYFDRAEPSSFVLASAMREKGAIVFFEPSSCRNLDIFEKCLEVSDIVKYSAERILNPPASITTYSPKLEIQTLGSQGLRYRIKNKSNMPGDWISMPSVLAKNVQDTTGAGDWCSAGIIHTLCTSGRTHFLEINSSEIRKGIRYGQRLAAMNCQYKGARGVMYDLNASVDS